MLLAAIARCVDQDAAADYAVLGDRLDRALLQTADGGLGIVAIVQLLAIPGVAQRVVLSSALREHGDDVVGVFEAAGKGFDPTADIKPLVGGHGMNWLRADRMKRITLRAGHRNAEHEDLALLDGLDAAQDFGAGQEIKAADLVVGAPAAPVLRQPLEYVGKILHFGHVCDTP